MNKPLSAAHLAPTQQLTTVFTSGNSQAVRLPKAFRFNSKTVEISRRGNEVVLREKTASLGHRLAEAMADLPPLSAKDAESFQSALTQARDLRPAQPRDWQALFEESPTAPTAKRVAARQARTRK